MPKERTYTARFLLAMPPSMLVSIRRVASARQLSVTQWIRGVLASALYNQGGRHD